MSQQNQQSLSSLMKKQMKEDAKKIQAKKIAAKTKKLQSDANNSGGEVKVEGEVAEGMEEMTEEEILEDAKKGSKNKAAQYDQTDMIKKLIMENIIKYVVLISVLVVLSIAVIKTGPALMDMLNGFLSKMLFGAIGAK